MDSETPAALSIADRSPPALVVCVPLIVVQLTVAGDVTVYVLGLDAAGTD